MEKAAQEYSFFQSAEANTRNFVIAALDHFFDLHAAVPSVCVLEFWRRLSLSPSEWTVMQYKTMAVRIVSPQDKGCPSMFENRPLPSDVAICMRDNYSPAPIMSTLDLLKGNTNGNSTNVNSTN